MTRRARASRGRGGTCATARSHSSERPRAPPAAAALAAFLREQASAHPLLFRLPARLLIAVEREIRRPTRRAAQRAVQASVAVAETATVSTPGTASTRRRKVPARRDAPRAAQLMKPHRRSRADARGCHLDRMAMRRRRKRRARARARRGEALLPSARRDSSATSLHRNVHACRRWRRRREGAARSALARTTFAVSDLDCRMTASAGAEHLSDLSENPASRCRGDGHRMPAQLRRSLAAAGRPRGAAAIDFTTLAAAPEPSALRPRPRWGGVLGGS